MCCSLLVVCLLLVFCRLFVVWCVLFVVMLFFVRCCRSESVGWFLMIVDVLIVAFLLFLDCSLSDRCLSVVVYCEFVVFFVDGCWLCCVGCCFLCVVCRLLVVGCCCCVLCAAC